MDEQEAGKLIEKSSSQPNLGENLNKLPLPHRRSEPASIRRTTAFIGTSDTCNMRSIRRMANGTGKDEPNEYELALLRHAENGNIEGIKEVFTQKTYYLHSVNVNCVDSLDRTALSLAILNGHIHVIEFLLSEEVENLEQGDALFYAIESEFYEAIELLLQKYPQTTLQLRPGTTSPFPPGLTPFMLAAHKNNYKILSVLYRNSHRLAAVKRMTEKFDAYSWDAVMERLLHYRARASPAFMLLMYNEQGMSWDPLRTAMELFGELKESGKREREVAHTYKEFASCCETFALELLQKVRSAQELADLMGYDLEEDAIYQVKNGSYNELHEKRKSKKITNYLKPISQAAKVKMKDFVTSDNAQLALIYIQKGELFRRFEGIKASALQFFVGLIFPILSIAFTFAPNSKLGRLMRNPTVKFFGSLMSEAIFVLLLLLNTILAEVIHNYGVGKIPPLLFVAYFWVLGKLVQEIKEINAQGLYEYFGDVWNWNDLFTILLYTAFMIFRAIYIIDNDHGEKFIVWNHHHIEDLEISEDSSSLKTDNEVN